MTITDRVSGAEGGDRLAFRPTRKKMNGLGLAVLVLAVQFLMLCSGPVGICEASSRDDLVRTIEEFAALGDRSTGTPGADQAAAMILKRFSDLGFEAVGVQEYALPVLHHGGAFLNLPGQAEKEPIHPVRTNVITPQALAEPGLEGPLVYVGRGTLSEFNEKAISNAIVLMEFDSGKNWIQAAALGAKALIFVARGQEPKSLFEEKLELTPLHFPCFWMTEERARNLFGDFDHAPDGRVSTGVKLTARAEWREKVAQNIYCLVPGPEEDEDSETEALVVEAFYDGSAWVADRAPAADQALGVAALLRLAKVLKENPPPRPILLVATSGHDQAQTGLRELFWALTEKSRAMKKTEKNIGRRVDALQKGLEALLAFQGNRALDAETAPAFKEAVSDTVKSEVDRLSQELMRLRLAQTSEQNLKLIKKLAEQRLRLRRLGWMSSASELTDQDLELLGRLVPQAIKAHETILADLNLRRKLVKSARNFRSLALSREIAAVVSLHLSSHGSGVGAFNQGWQYVLKPTINRTGPYTTLDRAFKKAAAEIEPEMGLEGMFKDTLRPSRLREWQSYLEDRPALGGEVSSLAGYVGVSLVTVDDGRRLWGTPFDRPEAVDFDFASRQCELVCALIRKVSEENITNNVPLRDGFSNVTGRAMFIRHGELFPDQPASGTVIMAFHDPGVYMTMVDSTGTFRLKGVADRKHVAQSVILEGYKFDRKSGDTIWAIDKPGTGKDAYRLKLKRQYMETDLIMFSCRQTTLFNLLEPRSFRYLTKIQLLDGRLESPPLKYWYSRIDTLSSLLLAVFVEPGTHLKMTLSDSVLDKKLILLNADAEHPTGLGYKVDDWPAIDHTSLRAAKDMWALIGPRITNLEKHGIFDEKIRQLHVRGRTALNEAEKALKELRYDLSYELATRSWALATRVYDQVEKTQKDVLFGVLFYIALFVPFSFCMERLVFGYADIHKRLIAFLGILLLLIAVVYQVHPAFQLSYSPTVVILAFFIMGLSLIVTLIIFFRFEEEMARLQRRASHLKAPEISRWQAFWASFLLGVNNLRRRRLRTALTCITLIILTFTVMSFTTVKTLRHQGRLEFKDKAPYEGLLLKQMNWVPMPRATADVIGNAFAGNGLVAPRVWFEDEDRTRASVVPLRREGKEFDAQGLIGLSALEARISGLDKTLIGGRWFSDQDRQSVLLPRRAAELLGIDPEKPEGQVLLWGMPFEVRGVFSGEKFAAFEDLDGEPVTPAIFPGEVSMFLTEAEQEALESGDDVRAFQSRYQHLPGDLVVIVDAPTLLAMGGKLYGIVVKPQDPAQVAGTAEDLVDRFKLTIFLGEKNGTFLYHASDRLSYSGVPNILIPILIAVFIVLNTMIGSVYERKREIGIYTSVGLAPSHVAFLFIAEAMAFAVLSVVLGYLAAQASAAVFAGTSFWSGITVNYSSLAGVAAVVLIFLVVLVSVIYPSRVAAQIAIPDVNKSWTMPTAEGAQLEFTLPMLMKYSEARGLAGFVYSYFQGHQDVSHGRFSTGEMKFDFLLPGPEDGEETPDPLPEVCFRLSGQVWLAPFDFGIMQHVDVIFCPALQDPGYLEIKLHLVREAGEAYAWHRINKGFINQLRKTVLLWRSLDEEAQRHFARMGETRGAD